MTGWMSVPSFTVIVPLSTFDVRAAEAGLQQALRLREALVGICHEAKPDDLFRQIDAKRQAKMPLSEEEQQYVTQADSNYLEMVIGKMEIAVLYGGDFFALSDSDRSALYTVVARQPGCSLISNMAAGGDRRVFTIDPRVEITPAGARKIVGRMIKTGPSAFGCLLTLAVSSAIAVFVWRYLLR